MGFAETAPLTASLNLKGDFASKLGKAQGALGKFSGSLSKAGKGVGQLGAGFARIGVVAGGVAAGGLITAAKAAIDFEDAFAGVRKTINEAELTKAGLSFDILAQKFRGMATEIPIAATEFARIGEAAGALGIKAQDIEAFTKTVSLLGVTTDLTSDQAAESLGKIGTILGFTGKDFEEFGDILVNLGNKGASVESEIIEITKRFSASGRQAGLSVAEITAYASAVASAGVEAESGGSSLSRLFGNLITETALATAKGKSFATVTGKSFKDFTKIVKDDTNGAMILFLRSLTKLDKFKQQVALEDVGITNVRDRNAILLLAGSIDKNLIPALDNAKNSQGALSAEAAKRFDTLKAQIQLLKNNITEAFITVGQGFLPSLKTATEKLIAFLKVDANKSALKTLGEDIGKTLDGIDWDGVLAGTRQFVAILKDAAGIAKTVLDTLNLLPTQVKAAGLGFLALNKLSGGLLGSGAGNLIGGLAGTVIKAGGASLPGLGRAFAQPVFVTNWPIGGLGGKGGMAGGVAAGGSALGRIASVASKVFIVGAAIGVFAELKGILDDQTAANKETIGTLTDQTKAFAGGATIADLESALAGIQATEDRLNSGLGADNLAFQFNIDGVRTAVENQKAILRAQLDALLALNPAHANAALGKDIFGPPVPKSVAHPGGVDSPRTSPASLAAIDAIMARGRAAGFHPTFAAAQSTNQKNLERLATAQIAATDKVRSSIGDTRSELSGIRMAVANARPPVTNVAVSTTVNVTAAQVSKSITIQKRVGPGGGSRERGPTEFDY